MNRKDVQLYPIELSLRRVKKDWGGWPGRIGEIWSVSCHPYESLAINGILAGQRLRELVGEFQQRLLGNDIELDPREPFPFLLRFVSSAKDLSIEVHPDDAYALENGLSMVGRDKLFYILNAKPGAKIYLGFRDKTSEKTVLTSVKQGTLRQLMNSVSVKPGDVYTVPAGRIHSIGSGVALLEVQRHSDLTFILSEPEDKGIDSHQLGEAFKLLDLNPTSTKSIPKVTKYSNNSRMEWLGMTPRFILRRLSVRGSLELSLDGSRFLVYTGLKGTGLLRWGLSEISVLIQPTQSVLVPAIPEYVLFESKDGFELLETSVPNFTGETIKHMIDLGIHPDSIAGLGGEDYKEIIRECIS